MPTTQRGTAWQAQVNHKGQRYRRQFPSEDQARAWEREALAALRTGRKPPGFEEPRSGNHMTLGELYELTYDRYWKHARAEQALGINGRAVRDTIGAARPVAAIGETDIAKAVSAWKARGNSDATINRKLAGLSKMLTYARDRLKVVQQIPVIDRLREVENRFAWWDEHLENVVLLAFRQLGRPEMVDFCVVAVDTGCRMSEMLAIEPDHIRPHGGTEGGYGLTIWQSKGGRVRTIPLTVRARDVLQTRGGSFKDITERHVRTCWEHMRAQLPAHLVDPVGTPHAMRHTFCSRLVSAGVDIRTVKELAGHSSITTTMRYSHLAGDSLSAAIAALESKQKANPVIAPHAPGVACEDTEDDAAAKMELSA